MLLANKTARTNELWSTLQMELIFEIPDYIILLLIGIGVILIWKYNFSWLTKWWWYLIWILGFGLVLPLISSIIEAQKHRGHMDDAFNLLYILFRWPVYWFLGFVGAIGIYLYARSKQINQENTP